MTARVIAAKHSLDIHKSLDADFKQSPDASKVVQMLMPSKDLSEKIIGALPLVFFASASADWTWEPVTGLIFDSQEAVEYAISVRAHVRYLSQPAM